MKITLGFLFLCLLSGCATVVNESLQPVRVETATESGELVAGADCTLTNDFGAVTVKSGKSVPVHRSGTDMAVVCRHQNNPEALARVISRANAGLYGNILIGGGIGAIIDHSQGTAYTYPGWIRLVFGRKLVLDRATEIEGQAVTDMGVVVRKAENAKVQNRSQAGVVALEELKDLLRDSETELAQAPTNPHEREVPKAKPSGLDDFRDLLDRGGESK
ncbi:hypothetical protein [Propionivibrio sp.]|uniref:hypothetical protein n=1 Tax=Propionivibrio sp. TaxID=2212460 RepID=UPI0039E23CC7